MLYQYYSNSNTNTDTTIINKTTQLVSISSTCTSNDSINDIDW